MLACSGKIVISHQRWDIIILEDLWGDHQESKDGAISIRDRHGSGGSSGWIALLDDRIGDRRIPQHRDRFGKTRGGHSLTASTVDSRHNLHTVE